jgi:enamine deaminase RidA (YjgF/YER057c/UK114 family)
MRYLRSTEGAAPLARYSPGVEIAAGDRLVICSGQLGVAADGSVPDSVREQTLLCLENAEAVLSTAGLDRSHVVKLTAYVTDRAGLPDYMAARDAFFHGRQEPPASTLLIVSGFSRPEFRVEVEVIAAAGSVKKDP